MSIAALSSMGFTLSDFKANGYSLRNITTAVEPSLIYVASMGYPIKEMRYAFTVKDFKDAGFTFQALVDGGQELMCKRPDGWPYLSEADFNLL